MNNKIKNLKINVTKFLLLVSLGGASISLLGFLKSEEKDNDFITVAEEIEAMKQESLNEKELVYLDSFIIDEIDKQIDEYQTEQVLNEQVDLIKEELLNKEMYKEEKYSGMNVSHEYEDYLKEKCMEYSNKYNIDYDTLYRIIMTIGYRESEGKWDNNSQISYTDDYGEFQINKCNLEDAKERFGYTTDDILNDRYKNADYFIDRICRIMYMDSCKSLEDVFGINNGWVDWKEKPISIDYSKGCIEIMNNYFDSKDVVIK